MMTKIKLLIILTLINSFVFSQEVTLFGNAKDYKNKKIIFYKYDNPITKNIKKLDSCIVSDNGDFNIKFDLNKTYKIFTNIGIYKAYLFAEPNKTYNIVLPPLVEKKLKDSLNPYFKPFEINLGIKNLEKNDLNILIQKFDNILKPYLNLKFYDIYIKGRGSDIDSMITLLDTSFAKYNNPYIKNYVYYKTAFLKFVSYERSYKYITHYYFSGKPVLYNNVAYIDLFDNMYNDYFTDLGHSVKGKYIYSNVNLSKSSNVIMKSLSKEILTDDTCLLEFITLKGLNDAIYDNAFKKRFILQSLDTLIIQSKINEHKIIAQKIKDKILNTKPKQNIKSFDFSLLNKDSTYVTLKDFRGKYVYLNFMYTKAYSCMKDYSLLEKIQKKYGKELSVVTIFLDTDVKKLRQFLNKNNYSWTFLSIGKNKKLISDYNVIAYPTYILIDPYGKIIANPARKPQEYFERYFVTKVLRNRK